jgi:3-phosphoshikimate 1-carboxyvinyltransferase
VEKFNIKKLTKSFNIEIDSIASDKSISHRCAMFSLFSSQTSYIKNYLTAEDTLNTLSIVEQLGATIKRDGSTVEITPTPILKEPSDVLDCGNSGTAMRLFCGLLASVDGAFTLTGDKYLRNRPMKRVADPLRSIGANIDGRENGNKAPLFIRGVKELQPFTYHSPVDSAQVKSAMILAALRANGVSKYKENELTRDHTDHPISLYAATKKSNEMMAHTYSHLYGICTTGLRFFTHINPCGFTDRGATSIEKEIGRPVPMEEVKRRLVEDLCENLNVKIYK